MVYFVLGLALFSPAPYLEAMRHLVEGLRGQGLLGGWHVPAKSSLFRARQRLGCEPLRVLFATTAKPMATEATPGAFRRGLRLLAVDATCWDVADSEANEAAFGRPGNGRGSGRSAFPQVRMAALVEVGSHAVLDAELAGCRTGEVTLVSRLPRSLGPGRLVLADREFLGVPLWQAFTATGADLLWRVPANRVLPVLKQFRDGSWLSQIRASSGPARHEPVTVRVLAYQLKGQVSKDTSDGYRLVTTLLDTRRHPARQLAALYCERWEVESVFAEIKTHQRGTRVVLSSKTPDEQSIVPWRPVQRSRPGLVSIRVTARLPVARDEGGSRRTACMPFWCDTRWRSSARSLSASTQEMPNQEPRVLNGMSWREKAGPDRAAVMRGLLVSSAGGAGDRRGSVLYRAGGHAGGDVTLGEDEDGRRRQRSHHGGGHDGVPLLVVVPDVVVDAEGDRHNPDPLARHPDITVGGVETRRVSLPDTIHQDDFCELTVPVHLGKGQNPITFRSGELPNFGGTTYASDTFPGVLLRSRCAPLIDRITVAPYAREVR